MLIHRKRFTGLYAPEILSGLVGARAGAQLTNFAPGYIQRPEFQALKTVKSPEFFQARTDPEFFSDPYDPGMLIFIFRTCHQLGLKFLHAQRWKKWS